MLTASESQRYDRQIRVWGAEAQYRIQTSKVLLCGLRGLNIEVAKNIVLAGMNIVIQDSSQFEVSDLSYAFCCDEKNIGMSFAESAKPGIQQLNKFATVDVETRTLDELPDDYFKQFTAVLVAQCSENQALRINKICRESNDKSDETNNNNILFFWSSVFGDEGCFISDFGTNFQYKLDQSQQTATVSVQQTSTVTTIDKDNLSSGILSDTTTFNNINANSIKIISFPSLENILQSKFNEISKSKHFPLSTTYLKFRVIQAFRDQNNGLYPTINDLEKFEKVANQLFEQNNIDITTYLPNSELKKLFCTCQAILITTNSVLGSFVSQEVIKGISRSGIPGYNVFVYNSDDYVCKAVPIGTV